MGFLEKILNRPKNERAVLLIPVGFPNENAVVPKLEKKSFEQICSTVWIDMSVGFFITEGAFDKEYDGITGKLYFQNTHMVEIL